MVARPSNLSTRSEIIGGSGVQGHPQLYSELLDSLGYVKTYSVKGGGSEMAQQVESPASQPDKPSVISRTDMVEEESQLTKVALQLPHVVPWCMQAYIHMHIK